MRMFISKVTPVEGGFEIDIEQRTEGQQMNVFGIGRWTTVDDFEPQVDDEVIGNANVTCTIARGGVKLRSCAYVGNPAERRLVPIEDELSEPSENPPDLS